MGLLRIPRTAPRPTEQGHNAQKVFVTILVLILKIYHKLPAFARNFDGKPLIFQEKFILIAKSERFFHHEGWI